MERKTGFEPAVPGLGSQCSTTEPLPLILLLLSFLILISLKYVAYEQLHIILLFYLENVNNISKKFMDGHK